MEHITFIHTLHSIQRIKHLLLPPDIFISKNSENPIYQAARNEVTKEEFYEIIAEKENEKHVFEIFHHTAKHIKGSNSYLRRMRKQ